MGNSSSHTHEPLERGFTRGKFGDVKNGVGFFLNSSSIRSPVLHPQRVELLELALVSISLSVYISEFN